ncbi:MAG: nucleotide exchange factor GrpE [Acidobacteriota bacterium]
MNETKMRSDAIGESPDELELDGAESEDLDEAMAEAVAAVEEVEGRHEGDEGSEVSQEVLDLRQEVRELRERSVRTLADFENYRKRSERERGDLRRYALTEAMREMLSVVDNFERALTAGGGFDDLKQGVEMILRQMKDVLRRQGVEEVPAEGEPFDPSVHEAVSRREDPAVVEPVVVKEMQKGYRLHERLLRPSIVEVAVPIEGSEN